MNHPQDPAQTSSTRTHSNWERPAIFAFGVVFLIVVLAVALFVKAPSPFAAFVFRVTLALAAGGVVAFLPGFIHFEIPKLLRAGGAIAVLAVIYMINPPSLIQSDDGAFEEAMRRAEAALAAGNLASASTQFEKARALRPSDASPYSGRGRCEYKSGNFAAALIYFQKASELAGGKEGPYLYSMEMAQESLGRYADAKKSLQLARSMLPGDSALAASAEYDDALLDLLIWQGSRAPYADSHFDAAIIGFPSYLERHGGPPQWAQYHLACLKALRSEDPALSESERAMLQVDARKLLNSAVISLEQTRSEKGPPQRRMMRKLLSSPTSPYVRAAGEPVLCPALVRTWSRKNGDIKKLLSNLSQE
jgi:tetratricopeptide (TPR) repeat protein